MENISCFNAFLILPYTRQTQTPTQQNAAERETTNIIAKSESRKAFTYLSFRLVRRIPFSNRKNLFFFRSSFSLVRFSQKVPTNTISGFALAHHYTCSWGKIVECSRRFPTRPKGKTGENIFFIIIPLMF